MVEKVQKIIDEISSLTVVELNELIKALEDKFGVSAATAFIPSVSVSAGSETKSEEGKSEFDIHLVSSGENKIQVIKILKEIDPNLSLKDAKDLVDNPPQKIAEKVEKSKAEEFKKKFEEVGAKVELK